MSPMLRLVKGIWKANALIVYSQQQLRGSDTRAKIRVRVHCVSSNSYSNWDNGEDKSIKHILVAAEILSKSQVMICYEEVPVDPAGEYR